MTFIPCQPSVIVYYHRRMACTAVYHKGRSLLLIDGLMCNERVMRLVSKLVEDSTEIPWPECGQISNADDPAAVLVSLLLEVSWSGLRYEIVRDFGEVSDSCFNPRDKISF